MGNTYYLRNDEMPKIVNGSNQTLQHDQVIAILQSIQDKQQEFYEQQRSFQEYLCTSIHTLVGSFQADRDEIQQPQQTDQKTDPEPEPQHVTQDPAREYRRQITELCNTICSQTDLTEVKEVLAYAYKTITRKYGIVWEQEKREYYNEHGIYPRSTLTMISESDDSKYYKGILKSILTDMAWNTKPMSVTYCSPSSLADDVVDNKPHLAASWSDVPDRIEFLADLRQDHSAHSMRTYAKIYALMDEHNDIDWNQYKLAYRQSRANSGNVRISKKDIIGGCRKLQELFIEELNKQIAEYQEGK